MRWVNDMLWWRSGHGIKLNWLGFASSRTTEQILIWYIEKLHWEFIPIPIALFPFPYFYSHSHCHSHDIVIVTLIPMGSQLFSFACTSLVQRQCHSVALYSNRMCVMNHCTESIWQAHYSTTPEMFTKIWHSWFHFINTDIASTYS